MKHKEQPILLDVSRAIWRASAGRHPTGIDRVCLAYVEHYRDRAQAVVQYRGFRRIVSPAASAVLFDLLLQDDPDFRISLARRLARYLPESGRDRAGKGRPYLNIGHTGLDDPGFRNWIGKTGVLPIYMVHDLIPITHPEYARPGEAERHERRMATVLETGAAVILNSDVTLQSLNAWGKARQLPSPPTQVVWLGTKQMEARYEPASDDEPYFLALGTIEGRKNHLLLLNLWRDWAARGQTPLPKLVIVGQRGWAADQTFAMLDRCPALAPYVAELHDCDDATLGGLIANARALLFPSFVEGYGMPLAEALMAGAPVIASDLTVFRELAGSIPTYCDPLDGEAWRKAILAYSQENSAVRASQCAALSHYQAPTWPQHFQKLDLWLSDLGFT